MPYSRDVYIKAKQELVKRRNKAESEQKLRHDEVCGKFPEILELEKEMARTGAEAVKAIGMGADAADYIEIIAKINLSCQKKREEILVKNGYESGYLETKYTCDKCNDTGLRGVYYCECLKKLAKRIAFDELSRSSPMELSTFDSFRIDYYPSGLDRKTGVVPREHMKNIFDFCRRYASEFSLSSKSLLMYGKTGLGKTHLSLAIARGAVDKGYAVVYNSVPNIMNKIEKEHFGKAVSGEDTFEMLNDCDLLILDDLGAEFQTSFTVATLYNIINNRLLTSLPTIISTNLDPKELEEKYTQRITSRFVGTYVNLGFCGSDIRQTR